MNARLHLSVRSTRTRSFGWAWVAALDTETGRTEHIRYGYAPTMPDALAEGHAALKVIEKITMDEVHASRARRRQLVGIATPPPTPTVIDLTDDHDTHIHTMEATA